MEKFKRYQVESQSEMDFLSLTLDTPDTWEIGSMPGIGQIFVFYAGLKYAGYCTTNCYECRRIPKDNCHVVKNLSQIETIKVSVLMRQEKLKRIKNDIYCS